MPQNNSGLLLDELFGSIREGIFFISPQGHILDVNPALIHMLGYDSREELQSINFSEIYEDRAGRRLFMQHLSREGSIQNVDVTLRTKNGGQIACLASGFATRDAAGEIARIQGTLVDVTERLEMERNLHREREFTRRLIERFPDVIAVLDLENRYTFVNERVKKVFGAAPEDFLGKTMGGRTHPDDQSALAEDLRSLRSGGKQSADLQYRVLHSDGTWRVLRGSAGPLLDQDGKITGIVASARDVTETLRIERELAQKEKLTAMGEMMLGAAHELNNPITAILGLSDLLCQQASDEASRRRASMVHEQARRASSIVQDLLAFSHPSPCSRAKLAVKDVMQQALCLHHAILTRNNISVKFEGSEDVPFVEGDAELLMRAFSNLIINAEQSIAEVRDRGNLTISMAATAETVVVSLADDGAGIRPENIGKIFDPFFTTRRPGGSGLGLTICLTIIREHGGTIEVESTPGAGATFRVLLPVAVETGSHPTAIG
jgi:PAS domain S-box-containing protein